MPEPRNQGEIVERFLMDTDTGNEVVDRLRIPGLAGRFNRPTEEHAERVDQVRTGGIKTLRFRPREEIAEVLAGLITDHRPGVTGIKWDVDGNAVEVRYVDGWQQRRPGSDTETKELEELLVTVLKSRRNFKSLDWTLGAEAVEVTYVA